MPDTLMNNDYCYIENKDGELRLATSMGFTLQEGETAEQHNTKPWRLQMVLWTLAHILHGRKYGPSGTTIVMEDAEFDRIKQQFADSEQCRFVVCRGRRRTPDPAQRWFMLAGIVIVSRNACQDFVNGQQTTCPTQMK